MAQFGTPLLTAIPQYPRLPREKNIWSVKKTDTPGIFFREFGKGRVVYFPWDLSGLLGSYGGRPRPSVAQRDRLGAE